MIEKDENIRKQTIEIKEEVNTWAQIINKLKKIKDFKEVQGQLKEKKYYYKRYSRR